MGSRVTLVEYRTTSSPSAHFIDGRTLNWQIWREPKKKLVQNVAGESHYVKHKNDARTVDPLQQKA